jgi:UDPglucose--hexose-1-phosphate uridylyltransferase
MIEFDFKEHPHTRLNILTGEWVLVSPHRTKRPWQGKTETVPLVHSPAYHAQCYLCPDNLRADGSINPKYKEAFAFTNDFSALLEQTPEGGYNKNDLMIAKSQRGICKVVCFSPLHNLTLAQMDKEDIAKVINLWQREFETLSANAWIKYIQIFENKGDIMGCSNPHPHGQIWSLGSVPAELHKETLQQKKYWEEHKRSLLGDYLQLEMEQQERIVCENNDFVALVPFWAVWPYETIIISKRQVQNMLQFNSEEKKSLAAILKRLTVRYDNLFETSFPYSAGMHQSPVNDGEHPEWHWHMHFYPPLLRSATVKKFMVGYEMLASPQRDISAEYAAERLRQLSEIHFTEKTAIENE